MTGSITFRCVWACARSLPGRSDKQYLEGQIFLRLDSSPLPAIRPDSPVCDTSDSECDSVSLGPSQPWYQRACVCVLRASVCSPSLCMKHFFNFLLLCVHAWRGRASETHLWLREAFYRSFKYARRSLLHRLSASCRRERRRAASPPIVVPLVRQTAHNRDCLSIRGHNRALLIHFTAVLLQRGANKDSIYEA